MGRRGGISTIRSRGPCPSIGSSGSLPPLTATARRVAVRDLPCERCAMAISRLAITAMLRSALTLWPCLIGLLGAVACRRSADPIGQEIRNVISTDKPPAYLEEVRWKLVRQIYDDRQYRPLWAGA